MARLQVWGWGEAETGSNRLCVPLRQAGGRWVYENWWGWAWICPEAKPQVASASVPVPGPTREER